MSDEAMLFDQVKRQEEQLSTVVNLLIEFIEGVEFGSPVEKMKPLADRSTKYLLIETNLGVRFSKESSPNQFNTIGAAITAARPGDVITVTLCTGVFTECHFEGSPPEGCKSWSEWVELSFARGSFKGVKISTV